MTMSLVKAMHILCLCHTRTDQQVGFTVYSAPDRYAVSQADYTDAWQSMRAALGLPTGPAMNERATSVETAAATDADQKSPSD